MTRKIRRRDLLKTGAAACAAATLAEGGFADEKKEDPASKADSEIGEPLSESSITHGGIGPVLHPRLGVEVIGQTCIRYLRFRGPVRVDRLELGRLVYGRHVPRVPNHPAHLIVSLLNRETLRWETLKEVDLPFEPEIAGEGLSQDMTIDEMETHFAAILKKPPHAIDLGGVETDHLRVVCDREHPIWPSHGEFNGGEFNVPFGILNPLQAFGVPSDQPLAKAEYNPTLRVGKVAPKAPEGMRVRDLPDMLLFESPFLSVGFSLRRPVIMHLGWDALGEGKAGDNRLIATRVGGLSQKMGGVSGPLLRTLSTDHPAQLWTGEVSVEGNRVAYHNLQTAGGLRIDAVFTVESDCLILELTQNCDKEIPAIEAEAWRLAWDLKAGITGMAAVPTERPGRNGDVNLPGMWASDGVGCLCCSLLEGDPEESRLQVESYRFPNCVTGGFVLGAHPGPDACQVVPAGTRHATFRLSVSNLEPKGSQEGADPGPGLKRHWATVFSCFRPEYRGFSNHSASGNCHLSQGPPIEIVAHTRRPSEGPDPLKLARFTIGKALLDGGGYGYFRNLYLDSDPVLLSAAGRIHQAEPNIGWLRKIEPGIVETAERMLSLVGDEGLVVCRDLTGNSGSYRWSSNSFDVVGFGHIDAYCNAWAYRAFRNAAALLDELADRRELAQRCREAATKLRRGYAGALLNPETKWVAGWRSRDGELHDYAFTWVNGVALAFGLLDEEAGHDALVALERKREEVGVGSARLGLPSNLLPIREEDHMLPLIDKGDQPTFETYTDGSLTGWSATYYLRALSICGLKDTARNLAAELEEGYAAGMFNGGNGSGNEFRSWEGLPTGYEGTLIGCFGPLYAIAIERGVLEPPAPEWWPENG